MKTKGFTLVELLVVIAILAILATVSVVGYTQYIQNADTAVAKEDLVQARTAVMAADINNNSFTLGTESLVWTVAKADAVDAAKAMEYVNAQLKSVAGLPGSFAVNTTTTTVEAINDAEGTQTGWKVTVKSVAYTTESGNGTATWTISGNKIQ